MILKEKIYKQCNRQIIICELIKTFYIKKVKVGWLKAFLCILSMVFLFMDSLYFTLGSIFNFGDIIGIKKTLNISKSLSVFISFLVLLINLMIIVGVFY